MPIATFSSTTMTPATLPLAFVVSSLFPLKFVATRLSDPPNAGNEDLTNGAAGAVVTPAGGDWTTPVLTVTLTLSAAYMASLGIGVHRFYVTGVNKRGLSASAESLLTVTA
jgi:hypothetical protein